MEKIIVNKNGVFLRIDNVLNPETENAVDIKPEQGFYLPRWNGEAWEEGATQEYIDSLKQPIQEPTLDERVANVEQEQEVIITVLADIMGV